MIFKYGKKNLHMNEASETYGYRFKYISIPICNYVYYKTSDIINFNSYYFSNQKRNFNKTYCKNDIVTNHEDNRILFYFINWKLSLNNSNNCNDCELGNYLSLSSSYFKNNKVLKKIIYRDIKKPSPLISDIGFLQIQTYFTEKNSIYFYDAGYSTFNSYYHKLTDEFKIDFSESIDERATDSVIESLEYKINIPNEFYIVPVIYECKINLQSGNIKIRTERELYPFNLSCDTEHSIIFTSMSNIIVFEMTNIRIKDLRDNLKFSIRYTSFPRIFKSHNGTFESINFSTGNFLNRNQNINFTWLIDLELKYYIKLVISNITNCGNIHGLSIQDSIRNTIYNKEQLCQNFKNGIYSYDFATNKILINFYFIKNVNQENPYFKCSYTSYLRIITQAKGEVKFNNSVSHVRSNWFIIAPRDYLIVVALNYVKQIDSLNQFVFSYLGNQYSEKGIYHYNIKTDNNINGVDYKSNIIVSNSNFMKIEYISAQNNFVKFFHYQEKTAHFMPSGVIEPLKVIEQNTSEMLSNLFDQSWIIKADHTKKIQIIILYVNLPNENPCSKAKISIADSKDVIIASLCGYILDSYVNTTSSEVNIRLTIQNDVIFYGEDQSRAEYNFKLLYHFIEELGDCYFQNRIRLFCGYENRGEIDWIVKDNVTHTKRKDHEYEKIFCENCFLEISSNLKTGKLISSLLPPSKKSLKFDYKLISGLLSVLILPNETYETNSLLINLSETNEWITAQMYINQSTFYRIIFEFSPGNVSYNAYAALDNIQLFKSHISHDRYSLDKLVCFNHESLDGECEKTQDNCKGTETCNNNGTCVNDKKNNSYYCICSFKYTGSKCEVLIDNNLFENFDNIFVSSVTTFEACKLHENPCNQLYGHGDCFLNSKNRNYSCSCNPLYTGDECEIKINKNCNNTVCNSVDKKAKCYNLHGKSFCDCSLGFTGTFCDRKDNCKNISCNDRGKCLNLINDYECKCYTGFFGNHCENSVICDNCISNNTVKCDTKNEKCVCNVGFTGKFCERKINFCNPNACISGICINRLNDYECICDKGFNGRNCDIESSICDTIPCNNGGTCYIEKDLMSVNNNISKATFFCECSAGYTGRLCQHQINFCNTSSCFNGGKCYNELKTYSCDCRNDYEGTDCHLKLNNCNSANCAYDSTCIDLLGDYRCLCPQNKYGKFCNYSEDSCFNNLCVNGACHNGHHSENQYTCHCLNGYVGDFCEHEINECSPETCYNGGTCYDILDQFICLCPQKYTGKKCETEVNYCSLGHCNYNSTERCISHSGGFKCICKEGYAGANCEIKINKCFHKKPCYSGICVEDLNMDYKCINCMRGYAGNDCSDFKDNCIANPCRNNATCFSKLNGHYCRCNEFFSGIFAIFFL